jgi:hypothetical protein
MKTDNVSGYGLTELELDGDRWHMAMAGAIDESTIGDYLWPSGPPSSVRFSARPPYSVEWWTMTGATAADITTMDPWVAYHFQTLASPSKPHDQGDQPGTGAPADRPNYAFLGSDGVLLEYVHARLIQRQGQLSELDISGLDLPGPLGNLLDQVVRDAVIGALSMGDPNLSALLREGLAYAQREGWTVAIGGTFNFGGNQGVTNGKGVYFGPSGELGIYDSQQVDSGFIGGAGAGVTVIGVKGSPSALSGYSYAVSGGASIFEILQLGGSLLMNLQGYPYGFAVEAGLGLGGPASAYQSVSHTRLWQVVDGKPHELN